MGLLILYKTKDVPQVEFMYLVFTSLPGESYRRRLRSLLVYLCDVFWALINSLVCWFIYKNVCVAVWYRLCGCVVPFVWLYDAVCVAVWYRLYDCVMFVWLYGTVCMTVRCLCGSRAVWWLWQQCCLAGVCGPWSKDPARQFCVCRNCDNCTVCILNGSFWRGFTLYKCVLIYLVFRTTTLQFNEHVSE